MPDPFELVKAAIASTVASVLIIIGCRVVMGKRAKLLSDVCCVMALGGGLWAGYYALEFAWTWLPANALNRFLTIILPVSLIVELLAAIAAAINNSLRKSHDERKTTFGARYCHYAGLLSQSASRILMIARFLLFAFAGRILLHESVYLNEASDDGWSTEKQSAILLVAVIVLLSAWFALTQLSRRAPPINIVFSLSLAICSAGCSTMMAGYIKGGTAALPLAAALLGAALASPLLMNSGQAGGTQSGSSLVLSGTIGVGLIGLFGLLWIGRFFGQLTNADATVMFFAPMLCWIGELPVFSAKTAKQKKIICLFAVAIPLAVVLWIAKSEFDRKMAPLLADVFVPDVSALSFDE